MVMSASLACSYLYLFNTTMWPAEFFHAQFKQSEDKHLKTNTKYDYMYTYLNTNLILQLKCLLKMLVRKVNFSRNQHRPQNVAWVGVGKMMMMNFLCSGKIDSRIKN